MATDTATKTPAARRHPLEVTSDRLAQALEDYPELFAGRMRDWIAQLRTQMESAVEGGLKIGPAAPAFGPPEHPGEPVDQRRPR